MERRRVSARSVYEPIVGYSRAVRAGPHVFVAGTAPIMPDDADPPPDAHGQARRCLEIVLAALAEVGARASDVVRTRVYLVRPEDWEEVGRAHGEVFRDVRPANTIVAVKGFVDPRWLVEIEVDAVVGG